MLNSERSVIVKLQDDEQVLHELHPQSSILVIWFFTKCIGPVVFISFIFSAGAFPLIMRSAKSIHWILAVVVLVFLGLALAYCSVLRKTYRYFITNRRCIFQGGILRRIERSIPYHKITDVEISQNILERFLGISSIRIFTPGTSSVRVFGQGGAEITFVGLAQTEEPAETVNNMLRQVKGYLE